MDVVWSMVTLVGHAVEAVFTYVEHHHWIFAFLAGGYVFYLHDRGSMRSTSASMKSASGLPWNIDRARAKPSSPASRIHTKNGRSRERSRRALLALRLWHYWPAF
jgi:hypothetical protein